MGRVTRLRPSLFIEKVALQDLYVFYRPDIDFRIASKELAVSSQSDKDQYYTPRCVVLVKCVLLKVIGNMSSEL